MRLTPAVLTATLALALAACGAGQGTDESAAGQPTGAVASPSSPPPTADTATTQPSGDPQPAPTPATSAAGSWVDLAAYEADPASYHAGGDVVLFFNASWCPSCRSTVDSLDAEGVPPGLTVVSVDYDTNQALRQRYAVTVQHTFVQVDQAGERLAAFTGAVSGAEIAAGTV
jgi:thiol-disulfide isomerase/thioredoxin